jgi:hypothetical protein
LDDSVSTGSPNSIDKKPSLRDFIVKVMKCNDVQTFEKNLSLAGCTI